MSGIPTELRSRIVALHGPAGRDWLEQLPGLLGELGQRWSIEIEPAFSNCRYGYVAPALRQDGAQVVVKLSMPGTAFEHEAACLAAYGGVGAPALLEEELARGALLMARVLPGTDLSQQSEPGAVGAALSVMAALHRANLPQTSLPSVRKWGEAFTRLAADHDGGSGPLPQSLVRDAASVFSQLLQSMGESVLLHGDLHHENILQDGRHRWLAIDPQGVIGEPAYGAGAMLRNPMPAMLDWPDLQPRLAYRVSAFADGLAVAPARIAGWGFSQAVLSAIWCLEDRSGGWQGAIRVAECLRRLV